MRLGILMKLDGKPAHNHIIDNMNEQVICDIIPRFLLETNTFSFIDLRAKEYVTNSLAWGDPFDQRHCTLVLNNHSSTSFTHVLEEEKKTIFRSCFLAVQDSSITDIVCRSVCRSV